MKSDTLDHLLNAAFLTIAVVVPTTWGQSAPLPKIAIPPGSRQFHTSSGMTFQSFGVNYYRPGTGWAPQLWKQFNPEATRADLYRMKELGMNCVRVFITYGSFLMEPQTLSPEGLAKFDKFLEIAEAAGIYVHPTGPDHWEGTPEWAKRDRVADDTVLSALEAFWTQFASRYRGRNVIFAYDLRNEPEVAWDSPVMREKWNKWLEAKYNSPEAVVRAWGTPERALRFGQVLPPEIKDNAGSVELLDYQLFREAIADEWTRRQARAIKAADPDALVTVGLIQWSVPALLPRVAHYSGFRPERQARFLDFLEIHFYPLARGFYVYDTEENERRNLAYLESVVREVAKPGKPVVVAEFGWYGGGQLTIDGGKHAPATEEQQARWCRKVIETTSPLAVGWLNWGFYDHPQARDVSQLTGLLTVDERLKAWGATFRNIARSLPLPAPTHNSATLERPPALDWNRCLTSVAEGAAFREEYFKDFQSR